MSLHNPKGGKNPHVHILATMRELLDGDKFSAKKSREWNETDLLVHWRESWAKAENDALEKAGRPERVDHRRRSKTKGALTASRSQKLAKEAVGMKQAGSDRRP